MAQTEQTPRKFFAPSAGTTLLDYSSKFSTTVSAEINVIKNNNALVNPSDFTVNVTTGIVTLDTSSVADDNFGVFRKTVIRRTTNLIETGQVRLSDIDDDLDRITRILQELNDIVENLCIRYDASINISLADTSLPAGIEGGVLQFDSNLQLVAVVPS